MPKSLTQKALAESLIKLLNLRPLDKISIKDIVEDCGVNRNTFYYHYSDIYDLLRDIFESEAQKVIDEYRPQKNWQEGFIQSAKFALENKRAIYHIYNSCHQNHVVSYLYSISQNIMLDYVKLQASGLDVSEEDIFFIALFYKHAFVGMVQEWVQNGMKDNPEIAVGRIARIFNGSVRFVLEQIQRNNLQNNS